MNRARCFGLSLLIALSLDAMPGWAVDAKLLLKKTFIEKYKNRVTIEADFLVDHAHKKPNDIDRDGDDGDLHFAGRSTAVGLPMVAEVVNAAQSAQQSAVSVVHQREKQTPKQAARLVGVWRLWFEHPPKHGGQQIQGQPVPVPKNTNPDHVFEIHPVTQIDSAGALRSFQPIPKFEAYDARTAFEYYEGLRISVQASQSAVLLSAAQAKYNYADFRIELQGKPGKTADGGMVLATILDKEGNTVVSDLRRMVFAEGTSPAQILKTSKKGDQLHVLGIPRINLERVSYLIQSAGGKPVVKQPLPYEMIIVGVFPD